MKNLVRTIVPLVIGAAIGFFVCKQFFCEKCPDCPDCPPVTGACAPTSEAPVGIISVSDAVELHESYIGEHYEVINSAMGTDFLDTQFVWFDYARIKQYLGYLEEVQLKNPNNKPISGIRVYFGAYDASHNDYSRQQTVFFTPTVDTNLNEEYPNMKNLPFYIQPTGTDPLVGKYKVIQGLLLDQHNPDERSYLANANLGHKGGRDNATGKEKMVQKSANAKNGDGGTSLSFNLGQLSPPPPRG